MPTDIEQLLDEQAQQYGVDPTALKALVYQESTFNPKAKSKSSSATGLGQFTDSTWQGEAKRLGLPYTLVDRYDPRKNAQMTAAHYLYNTQQLGVDPSKTESLGPAYLAHFRGIGGAKEMMSADPNADPNQVLSNWGRVVRANPFLRNARTVQEAKDLIVSKATRHVSRFGGEATEYDMAQVQPQQEQEQSQYLAAGAAPPETSNNVRTEQPTMDEDQYFSLIQQIERASGGVTPQTATATPPYDDASTDFPTYSDEALSGGANFPFDPSLQQEYQTRSANTPMRLQTEQDLRNVGPGDLQYGNAQNELTLRERFGNQSFIQNITDPQYLQRKGGRLARQHIAGYPRAIPDTGTLMAMGFAPFELAARAAGLMDEQTPSPAAKLLRGSAELHNRINKAVGIDEPQDPIEKIAEIAGPAAIRIAPNTRIKGGLANALEVATPFTVGAGRGRRAMNVGAQFLGHEILRDTFFSTPDDPYRTIFDRLYPVSQAEAAEVEPPKRRMSQSGPALSTAELQTLGLFGLATVGFGAGPSVVRLWRSKRVDVPPASHRVDPTGTEAPMDLQSIETAGDIRRTYFSGPTEGLKSILQRSGSDVADDLALRLDIDTYSSARTKVDTALATGRMESYAGKFNSPIAPKRYAEAYKALPKERRQMVNQYLHLNDMIDDFNKTGEEVIGGMTRQEVQRNISNIVRAFPDVKKFHESHQQIIKAVLDYAAQGRYGVFSQKKYQELLSERPNYVHYEIDEVPANLPIEQRLSLRQRQLSRQESRIETEPSYAQKRDVGRTLADRPDAVETMMRYTENVLSYKMKNQMRAELVNALKKSPHGSKSVKRIAVGEKQLNKVLQKRPQWRNRLMAPIWVNGRAHYYVASQHVADVSRFDPAAVRHSWFYAAGRSFQINTTGAASPEWAIYPFVRDTLLGSINQPSRQRRWIDYIPGGRLPQSAIAVPRSLTPQLLKGVSDRIYRTLDSGEGGKVIRALTGNNEQIMRSLADRGASAYYNSYRYMIDAQGGINAALSQNPMQHARKSIDEFVRNKELPHTARQYWSGWREIIDAVQNGARFAYYTRNVDPKKMSQQEMRKVLREAKELTGDITKAGQPYSRMGKVSADAQKTRTQQWAKYILEGGASTQRFLLESSPYYNAMLKGLGRFGKAYWNDPFGFQMRLWTTVMIPQLYSYVSARSLGPEYVEYMMDHRDERKKAMGIYIPIPGRPPEEGLDIPIAHEMTIPGYTFLTMLDHMSRGQQDRGYDEFTRSLRTVAENVTDLTMPPLVTTIAGSKGVKASGGVFFSDVYTPKPDPSSNFNHNLEMMIRGLGGGNAATFINTVNAGIEGGLPAAKEEFLYQRAQRSPLSKENRLTSFTRQNDVFWDQRQIINNMLDAYRHHVDPAGIGKIYKRDQQPLSGIDVPPNQQYGEPKVPKPTNPIYNYFAKELKRRFGSEKGHDTFKDNVDMYNFLSNHLEGLRKVHSGNLSKFFQRVIQDPEMVQWLGERGITQVDRNAPQLAINEMIMQRNTVTKRMLSQMAEMEQVVERAADPNSIHFDPQFVIEMARSGITRDDLKDFRLEKLDPYWRP